MVPDIPEECITFIFKDLKSMKNVKYDILSLILLSSAVAVMYHTTFIIQ